MKEALLRVTAVAMLALTGMLGAGGAKPAYAATTIPVDCTNDSSALTTALASRPTATHSRFRAPARARSRSRIASG
jgi:hypothetical protein